jgi:hypothetical protein
MKAVIFQRLPGCPQQFVSRPASFAWRNKVQNTPANDIGSASAKKGLSEGIAIEYGSVRNRNDSLPARWTPPRKLIDGLLIDGLLLGAGFDGGARGKIRVQDTSPLCG